MSICSQYRATKNRAFNSSHNNRTIRLLSSVAIVSALGIPFSSVGHADTFTTLVDETVSYLITGELIKNGNATLTITGMNTFTGQTLINAGTLALSGQGRISASSNVVVTGTLDVTAAMSANINNLSGSGIVIVGGTALHIHNAASTFSGEISGGGINISSGTQILTGNNTYLGSTGISPGATLQIGNGGTSGSIIGNVNNHGTLIFNRSNAVTFTGEITGVGSFEHNGTGKLTLTADSSSRGDVKIASGSVLQLGNGGTSGLIGGTNYTGTITNDGQLIYDRSNTVNWKGIYAGSGEIIQAGQGSLNLTGDSSGFAGTTIVKSGRLTVGNSLGVGKLGGDFLVENGALLGGSGTIGSGTSTVDIKTGGTLAAGNSIGTLDILGDVAFDSGSVFEVEVNDGGNVAGVNADTTTVSGDVNLSSGSTVKVRAANGTDDGSTYAPGTTYTILSYGGTRTGQFNSVVDENFAFLNASLSYDPNAVLLNLTRNDTDFAEVANTPNQAGAANALGQFDNSSPVYQQLLGLSEEQARDAYDSVSGEIHAAGEYMTYGNLNMFGQSLGSQGFSSGNRTTVPVGSFANGYVRSVAVTSQAANAISAIDHTRFASQSSIWFSPLGGRGSIDSDGNGAGYDWKAAGFATGYETNMPASNGDFTVGLGVGYLASWSESPQRTSSSDSHGGYVGIYGDWVNGPTSISAQLAYGLSRVSTSRDITVGAITERAEADYWSHNVGLGVEAAYAYFLNDEVSLSPLATVSVTWSGHGEFRENGAGALNATVGSQSDWRLDTGLGLELARQASLEDGSKLTLKGRALWGHRVGSTGADTTITLAGGGSPFEVSAAEGDRDRLILGAGLSYAPSARTTFSVDYSGEFAGSTTNHAGKLGIKLAF